MAKNKIEGILVSVWEHGQEIKTPAILDKKYGSIETNRQDVPEDMGELLTEYFSPNSNLNTKLEICGKCHSHIIPNRTLDEPKTMNEEFLCFKCLSEF